MIATSVNGFSFSELTADISPDEESRIYSGANAMIGTYMASLRAEDPESDTFCGGALIASQLDYLLLRPQAFRMYCDHRNLIHVFAPHDGVKKHVRG
ncbi:hypothetical protein JG687_00015030 [Phytophthora cactorum]|uniref:Reverse transcriptase RNase H-like domain-containing protein n=1 Tax=Phytophthora cactorum TaxID=29920 RepID=A0A329SJT1_9STRA|nr:hypothetical protein Pcac1_g11641 [Phytophthora cactorum]KAG2849690.1 hypothetical protein PC113_g17340 [Phytophthora cactorum]KAG4042506.1 hypothetical protein PC123_g22006 [Phytophthora cactorum]KAG4228726.1 hypothetical protein PC116_g22918 [Phytophthora cactorum]KAG6949189.1 hypothetical protein JG687_00015030 [Phytophthora cactorum]